MENVSDKTAETIKAHFSFSVDFFPQNRNHYEIMWKTTVVPDLPQMTI